MSDYEKVEGTLIPLNIGMSLEESAEAIATEKGWNKGVWHKNWAQVVSEEGYKEYYVGDSLVYKVDATVYRDDYSVFHSSINPDGSIDFVVLYYNGGMGFDEAITEALK